MRYLSLASISLAVLLSACSTPSTGPTASNGAGSPNDGSVLPYPDPAFGGTIARNAKESKSDFPVDHKAPKGAPNVLVILTDDVGYGASSTFGGPIATPTYDKLAASGLRYNEFHTTALCSPTRAALITGRNHHNVASGMITEMATGFPGYNSLVSKSTASAAEILKQNGWNTSWWGKMHNVPDWMSSTAGPFDLWPTGLGFEKFYGFVGGDAHQWRPALYDNTTPIEPYLDNPDYILDEDLGDQAVGYIRRQQSLAPEKPFFMYYCTGTAHAPHHAKKDWIAKYKGKFDQGWDKIREETFARQKALGVIPEGTVLTPRPEGIPAWDSMTPEQKRMHARFMEVYAGALSQADHNIGRVIDAVEQTGELDNTIIIYIMGDNGASAEGTVNGTTNEIGTGANGVTEDMAFHNSIYDQLGSMTTYNHYSYAWAHAMNTPFQWTKQVASHFGGTRNGMVISYPKGMTAKGEVRSQFHHVIDIVPTILDLCGVKQPTMVNGVAQKPMDGVSMAYSFNNAKAPGTRNTQYFELAGNRAIYHDGWVACTTPFRKPWQQVGGSTDDPAKDFAWELYNVAEDYSEATNLASTNAAKLKEMQDLFYKEAERNNVLPLDATFGERADPAIRPSLTRGRTNFTYYEGAVRIPEGSAPDFKNKSWSIAADVDGGNNGVLCTMGGFFGGFSLLVKDGKPMFMYSLSNQDKLRTTITSAQKLTAGEHTISIDLAYDGGGMGKGANVSLKVDGKEVAKGRIEKTIAIRFSLDETWDVGEDTGTPLDFGVYDVPFKYNGELEKVTVVLK